MDIASFFNRLLAVLGVWTLSCFLIFYTKQIISVKTMLEKTLYVLFKGRFSNRKWNTLNNILKANCQLFFLTQFVRLFLSYHAFCLYLYLCRYISIYIFQLVHRQPLTQAVRLSFAYNIQSFSPFSCLILAFLQSFVNKAVSLAC